MTNKRFKRSLGLIYLGIVMLLLTIMLPTLLVYGDTAHMMLWAVACAMFIIMSIIGFASLSEK